MPRLRDKIEDGELQCPHCGSLVVDMKARIAAAEEKIVYTDAVSPSQTSKLPLVSERSYQDVFGNPLDPSNEVDASNLTRSADDLNAIPTIGDEDPFITKPMQRIVADGGQVVAWMLTVTRRRIVRIPSVERRLLASLSPLLL